MRKSKNILWYMLLSGKRTNLLLLQTLPIALNNYQCFAPSHTADSISLLLEARSFGDGFLISYGLWLVMDWYDALILDIGWFCHSKKVVIPGTEDLTADYRDYWFHIKGSLIGMALGLPTCILAGGFCRIMGAVL